MVRPRHCCLYFFLCFMLLSFICVLVGNPQAQVQSTGWKEFANPTLSLDAKKEQQAIQDYARPAVSTYMIFPEWYIVYSSQEYAKQLETNLPSHFPYFSEIAQYWWGYKTVYGLTKKHFTFDGSDHFMLMVIGTSFTLEYLIKGFYENTIGRLSEWSSDYQLTEEDHYAAKIAKKYADFIPVLPWFEFSFAHSLKGLWQDTTFFGPHQFRKLERKFILTIEYSFKALYSEIILLGTHLTYGTADSSTYALINGLKINIADVQLKKQIDGKLIIGIPSEQPFTTAVMKMDHTKNSFVDIASNNEILVTALAPRSWHVNFSAGQELFTMNVLTNPEIYRVAMRIPVNELLNFLYYLQTQKVQVEHIYDY